MYIYYCWITALLPSYQDKIVAGLAERGYMVGPASKDGKVAITAENCPSVLFALSVYREEETNVNKIYDDVVAILGEMKAYYYSIVVSLSHEATWVGPNFQIPAKEKTLEPPLPPAVKKNMN